MLMNLFMDVQIMVGLGVAQQPGTVQVLWLNSCNLNYFLVDEWTCPWSWYANGTACDCICGASDPDCSNSLLPTTGCSSGYRCSEDICIRNTAILVCVRNSSTKLDL